MHSLIKAHLQWCTEAGKAPATIYCRRYVLEQLDRAVRAAGVPAGIEAANAAEIRKFVGGKTAPWTRVNYRMHVSAFFAWAVDVEEVLDWNPMPKVPKYRQPKGDPQPVPPLRLATILAESVQPWRYIAYAGTFAGLRAREIERLAPVHVQGDQLRITGKGGKTATVDLHPLLAAELATFPGSAPYIEQAGGRGDRWVSRNAGAYYSNLVGSHVTVHMFRASFCTGILAATGNLEIARQAARHESTDTTLRYARLVDGERRRGVLALTVPGPATI